MPLPRTPLEPALLTDGARKALAGPPPLKLMAARGLAPLRPLDLALVLYQLALDCDPALQGAAHKSAAELPEKVLGGALTDGALDPRVLDFFAEKVRQPALIEAILLNRATADETVAALVPRLGERELDLVATNEQRLLRHPAIVGALYMTPKARASTVDRAVELAVRNGVAVPGIPGWQDLAAAVLGAPGSATASADADMLFSRVAAVAISEGAATEATPGATGPVDDESLERAAAEEARRVEEEKQAVPIDRLSVPQKIRLATLGNAFARSILIRDVNRQVALAAVRSPGMTENEILKHSANRLLSDDVIRVIANTKEWTKLYGVKLNLVFNPKCPLVVAMRLLPFLHERDLRNLARSRSVPSALTAQARKLLQAKAR